MMGRQGGFYRLEGTFGMVWRPVFKILQDLVTLCSHTAQGWPVYPQDTAQVTACDLEGGL